MTNIGIKDMTNLHFYVSEPADDMFIFYAVPKVGCLFYEQPDDDNVDDTELATDLVRSENTDDQSDEETETSDIRWCQILSPWLPALMNQFANGRVMYLTVEEGIGPDGSSYGYMGCCWPAEDDQEEEEEDDKGDGNDHR